MNYGDRRNLPKIDIYINGKYECSTTWARTCKEAIKKFEEYKGKGIYSPITAHFAN